MRVDTFLSWILGGLIVGLLVRAFLPGWGGLSLELVMFLSILGSLLGGFVYSLLRGAPSQAFSLTGSSWQNWVFMILGAVTVLWVFTKLQQTS